ncbi:MAG TPA: 3-hydroxyacyl-CoA dehydrogenase [Bryobacteraceae bacterium]|nr:3-hydroxyacyl-CoA dehydrogenase [Bryobacteraceae bacterium]
MNITDKVALITGGASGLGAATARMILRHGGKVGIIDRNEELGREFAAELGAAARFFAADVADPDAVQKAVDGTVTAFGGLNICVNCAGIGDAMKIVGKEGPGDLQRFSRVIRVNLIGTFNTARLAAWVMVKNEPNDEGERGVIVNTASVAAYDGQIGQAAYSASKGGIAGMTLPLARDLARDGVRVMTIAPGLFDTPLLAALPDNVKHALGAMVPFPSRLGRPDEYAQLAQQIIENPMLNGEVIRLDGAIRMAPR